MKLKKIEWADISRYRGELMGVAILIVVLFHVALPRSDMFFGLRRIGNVGVDMFFLISGLGLWFSWMKNSSSPVLSQGEGFLKRLCSFYKRRLLRIYPIWLLVAGTFYIQDYFGPHKYSANLMDLCGDILINWDFWLHDELTFWYVPAIMMMYLFAPFYMELIRKHPVYRWLPVVMMTWCVAVQWVGPIHHAVGHIEIFWSRIPIFLIGINIGECIRRRDTMEGAAIWLLLVTFVLSLGTCIYLEQVLHGKFPLFIERMVYIPMTMTGVLLLSMVFSKLPEWVNGRFRFVGGISLEIYLVHCQFVLYSVQKYHLGYWPTFLLVIAITLPIAWLLQKLVNIVMKRIKI